MAFYFAYGSNLDYTRMFKRCPNARAFRKATLWGYRLVFMENNAKRIVANIVPATKKDYVVGMVYSLSEKDLDIMDGYEGSPVVYHREQIVLDVGVKEISCITYVMPTEYTMKYNGYERNIVRGYGVPKDDYFKFIVQGYTMWNMKQGDLMKAYKYSMKKGKVGVRDGE